MQILTVAELKAGSVFAQSLFHASGRKLLPADAPLTQQHIDALVGSGIKQIFLAENVRPVLAHVSSPSGTVAVSTLAVGATVEADLMTPDGAVLIQQDEQVEEHHLAAMQDSGTDVLIAHPARSAEAARATLNDLARVVVGRMDALIRREEYLSAPESQEPFIATIQYPATMEILNINAVQLLRRRLTSRLQPVFGMLETGKQPNFDVLQDIAEDLIALMHTEPRQFSQLALMTARRDDYLPDHAISVAVLSMAIAAHMGLSLEMVKEVILGSLLADVGMLMVPRRIRASAGVLTEVDRRRVQQHPVYSLTMMEMLPGLSPIPRLIGYQHHERLNGRGYPAAVTSPMISEFARIVAAADVFAATANPRAYKSPKLPYGAMEEVVHMVHKGLLDPRVLKALLSAIGLFPVGSYVLLSNHMTAQVVGANATRIDRPLIRPIVPGGNPTASGLVDLSSGQFERIKVIRSVAAPVSLAGQLSGA